MIWRPQESPDPKKPTLPSCLGAWNLLPPCDSLAVDALLLGTENHTYIFQIDSSICKQPPYLNFHKINPSSTPGEKEVEIAWSKCELQLWAACSWVPCQQRPFLRMEGDAGTLLAASQIPHHLSAWDPVLHLGLFALSELRSRMNMLHWKTNLPRSQLSLSGEETKINCEGFRLVFASFCL